MFRRAGAAIRRFGKWLSHYDWAAIIGSGLVLAFCLFVIVPTLKPHEQRSDDSKHNGENREVVATESAEDRIATYTLWLTVFTALLAGSTIALWYATERAVKKAEASSATQSKDMRKAIEASNRLAEATEAIARAGEHQAFLSRIGRDPASQSVRVARQHLELARKDRRAWLKIADVDAVIIRTAEGFVDFSFRITVENVGPMLATNVWIEGAPFIDWVHDHVAFGEQWDEFRNRGKETTGTIGATLVFPDDSTVQGIGLSIPVAPARGVGGHIFVGAFYRYPGDPEPHETTEAFTVYQTQNERGEVTALAFMRSPTPSIAN